jgi:hypothetical protein
MTIQEFIQKEAPDQKSPHDQNYAIALQEAYDYYKGMNRAQLEQHLSYARECYRINMSNHKDTARCIVIYALINEKLGR